MKKESSQLNLQNITHIQMCIAGMFGFIAVAVTCFTLVWSLSITVEVRAVFSLISGLMLLSGFAFFHKFFKVKSGIENLKYKNIPHINCRCVCAVNQETKQQPEEA